ncbi:MAG TPA: hypothetical protein VF974_04910 [Patescibacteria group bacterium]
MDTQQPSDQMILLKEVSDIKEKLATNTEATKNTANTLVEIKQDLKVFQNSFVTHEEFDQQNTDKENRIRTLEQFKWQLMGALIVFHLVTDYILYIILKK